MINLILFVIIIALLNQIGYFLIVSVVLKFLFHLYHYLLLILLVIFLGFIGWCFDDDN